MPVGLGTAAFGLVDATKVFDGGANRISFAGIKAVVTTLAPPSTGTEAKGLTQAKILDALQANWFNGTDLASQKAIANSRGLHPDELLAIGRPAPLPTMRT